MWDRKELKAKGKIAFKANYWRCVLVAFLASLLTGTVTSYQQKEQIENITQGNGAVTVTPEVGFGTVALIGGAALLLILVLIAISILLINPLSVGCNWFFVCNRRDAQTDLNSLEVGFRNNYKNNVIVMFMTQLFISLWSLLLIVPGIIKSYEYRLVPYILAEEPDTNYKIAMAKSKDLMYGNKMEAFKLDLSFIGWVLLGGLTLNILNILYVFPYIEATNAELYVALAHPGEGFSVQTGVNDNQTVEFEI